LTLPKVAVLRSLVMNHMIHHRGQLAAFYRIAGVPIPSIYGPSKDEQYFNLPSHRHKQRGEQPMLPPPLC